jgi:hypothetical protein
MRRLIASIKGLLGLSGSAKAARYIGKLEKTAHKLNDAVTQSSNELYEADVQFADVRNAFYDAEAAHNFARSQRTDDRARAQRVAFRLIGLVS